MDQVVKDTRHKMQRTIDALHQEFLTVRTGKASPALVENIVIMAYGGTTPLKVLELATIGVQNNTTIVISPFDKSIISDIEKGISNANVGLNPIVDGEILRINLPPLTEERRTELSKLVKQKAEVGKVSIRQVRHEGMEDVEKMEKDGLSEDEKERLEREIQKATDEFVEKIDLLSADKEKELMTL